MNNLKHLPDIYLNEFKINLETDLEKDLNNFLKRSKKLNFDYLKKSGSVFSSKIEGNSLDLNSFMNSELNNSIIKNSKDKEEIDNLIKAYDFAVENKLSESNLLKIHSIASKNLVIKDSRGKYRQDKVGVFGKSGLIYLAVEPEFLEDTMKFFFKEIDILINSELNIEEIFYYASFIHLRFVHIHPFSDGNGRVARILEKWFLSQKLGKELWKIQSEQYYWENIENYYINLNLGVNFYELDYSKSTNFLQMLRNALKI